MRKPFLLAAAVMAAATVAIAPAIANASAAHPEVVSENPADYTPSLVWDGVSEKPRIDAISQAGSTLYAGGLFSAVESADGSKRYVRNNIMAFNADTGAMSETFAPNVNGNVWAVEATDSAVYIGGTFTTVNGASRAALAKLDPDTGAVDTNFRPPFSGGRIDEIKLVNGRLIVGGKSGQKLMALNPTTGKNTGYINLGISNPIPNAWGGVAVYSFDVNRLGTQLVATGNFQTVGGESRTRLFVLDLGPTTSTLSSWYYQPFEKPCASTHSRRIAYLQGVDYSPDGSYFVVTATGQIVATAADRDVTVCDAAGRFDLADDTKPAWINYTGGDSVWSVAATGAAVYVQGHFSWLDNPRGFASKCPADDLDTCDARKGVGAIDPMTGEALPWNPSKPAQIGGKDFLATDSGLWIGSDSETINRERHRGLAFMPLPSGPVLPLF